MVACCPTPSPARGGQIHDSQVFSVSAVALLSANVSYVPFEGKSAVIGARGASLDSGLRHSLPPRAGEVCVVIGKVCVGNFRRRETSSGPNPSGFGPDADRFEQLLFTASREPCHPRARVSQMRTHVRDIRAHAHARPDVTCVLTRSRIA